MFNDNIHRGYISKEKALEVKDYPYGFRLRTSKFYWIESKPKLGDRLCTYTINPKNGKPHAPKFGTYSPFLYLYTDENGHVKAGGIDAYDRDEFEIRFNFILARIGVEHLQETQKENLRVNYYDHVRLNCPYEAVRYSDEKRPLFFEWVKAKLKHIGKCDFKDLIKFAEENPRPEEDNPQGEVKYTFTQYKTV